MLLATALHAVSKKYHNMSNQQWTPMYKLLLYYSNKEQPSLPCLWVPTLTAQDIGITILASVLWSPADFIGRLRWVGCDDLDKHITNKWSTHCTVPTCYESRLSILLLWPTGIAIGEPHYWMKQLWTKLKPNKYCLRTLRVQAYYFKFLPLS